MLGHDLSSGGSGAVQWVRGGVGGGCRACRPSLAVGGVPDGVVAAGGTQEHRADRGLGDRRDELPEEGATFGRGGAAVLRDARQGSELSGGGERQPGEPKRERASRLAPLPAEGVGGGRGAARAGGRAAGGGVRAEVGD